MRRFVSTTRKFGDAGSLGSFWRREVSVTLPWLGFVLVTWALRRTVNDHVLEVTLYRVRSQSHMRMGWDGSDRSGIGRYTRVKLNTSRKPARKATSSL
jgi:hypothetical protein